MYGSFYRSAGILFWLLLVINVSIAQQIENLFFRQDGLNIMITYDLIGDTEKIYFITVFGSHDNFTTPIELITGDVGAEISPGAGKRITWDAKRELGEFKGNLRIRIHAKLTPIIEFENVSSRFRRGKSHEIQWKTGTSKDNIQFELYRGNELINDLGQIPNTGSWNWAIPKNQKAGKGFRFKAIALNKTAYSVDFRISRKTPLMLKIAPFAIGIGVAAILVSRNKKEPIPLPLLPD